MQIRVLKDAKIFTGEQKKPWTESLAIAGERIVSIGDEVLQWEKAPGAVVENMDKSLVIPGFCDAHIHLMWYALSLREINLRDCSRKEMLKLVKERAKETPPGQWILGRGWDQNQWSDLNFPTASEIDAVTTRHPVTLIAKNAHALVANSTTLKIAGISRTTPNPAHGSIARDRSCNPTGMFFEDATQLVKKFIPEASLDELMALLIRAQKHLLRQGITSVHDVDGGSAFTAFQELRRQNHLAIRIVKYIRHDMLDGVLNANLRSGYGDEWLRLGGLKLFADGALGSRTAALYEPYDGETDNKGILTLEPDALSELAYQAAKGGLALAIHAIGDLSNKVVLDAIMSVQALNPHLRHRIEHVQLIDSEDQVRLARSGIIASMQPVHAIHDADMVDRYWGERGKKAYTFRSLLDLKAILAFGSDAPIEVFDPFLGLYAAVARRREKMRVPYGEVWYPEQRLSLAEALRAYTWGGAYAAHLEDRLGKLFPGYTADLAVLDKDIFEHPPDALLETKVKRVMVAGHWVALD